MIAPFRYRLAILAHGDAKTLARTLASFDEMVRPAPYETVIVIDGPTEVGFTAVMDQGRRFNLIRRIEPQRGFCVATQTLRALADAPRVGYVFWLEADFEFTRTVRLEQLGTTLRENPDFVQMSLMRGPVNQQEREAGSLVKAHPDWFHMHFDPDPFEHAVRRYMSQRVYWTTNPALIPRAMLEWEWPTGPECEGVFSHRIRDEMPESRFGVWGHGEKWIEHIGERDASGVGY